jgi:transcriptional regulator with XRE-family HTH domain
MNNLGNKLKFSRKKINFTQEDLTCEIINRSSLSKIENNLLTPSVIQLSHLAKQLNISIDYLLDDKIPIVCDLQINKNKNYIEQLYSNHSFLDIIERFKPQDFTTTYYVVNLCIAINNLFCDITSPHYTDLHKYI